MEAVPKDMQSKYPHVKFKTPLDLAKPNIIPIDQRDTHFDELGLKNELSGMDEADKDILYWRLKNSSVTNLKDLYPSFPPIVWIKLKKVGKK